LAQIKIDELKSENFEISFKDPVRISDEQDQEN